MNKGFVKLMRDSENFWEMVSRRPSAFVLLTLIAMRARRTNDNNFDDLEIGEALIGDYETYGSTEQVYRTDKEFLKKYNFITIKSTTRGTIAKLVDTTIFDINFDSTNEQTNEKLTNSQRTANEQPTTNKNVKKEKNEKNVNEETQILNHFNDVFDKKFKSTASWSKNFSYWRKTYSLDEIKQAIVNAKKDSWWKDKLDMDKLFRTHEDRIGQLLNRAVKKSILDDENEEQLISFLEGMI